MGDFCGFERTSFVLISCLVANKCVVGVIGISVVNVFTALFFNKSTIKLSSSASGLAISSDMRTDCLTGFLELSSPFDAMSARCMFRSSGITFSSGMTFGTKTGKLSDVGLSGWTGEVDDAGCLECSTAGCICGLGISEGFLSGMIGISFGGGWLMASIGGDEGHIGGEDGVSESSVVFKELRVRGGWVVLKDISGMI